MSNKVSRLLYEIGTHRQSIAELEEQVKTVSNNCNFYADKCTELEAKLAAREIELTEWKEGNRKHTQVNLQLMSDLEALKSHTAAREMSMEDKLRKIGVTFTSDKPESENP